MPKMKFDTITVTACSFGIVIDCNQPHTPPDFIDFRFIWRGKAASLQLIDFLNSNKGLFTK